MSRARGFKWDNVEKKQYTVAAGGAKTIAGSATATAITVSATAPVSPSNGDSWFDSINAALYIYYFDGTSSQWAIADGSANLGETVIDGGGVGLAAPTYSLSTTTVSANEGTQFTITLTTTNVVDGTNIPYTITGVSSADISDASLTGVFDVQGNTASTTFTVADDTTTEGEETFTLSLDALSTTQNVTINDTSIVPAGTVVDYLVVAGGGAGGQAWGAGGAGGLLTNSNLDLSASTAYTIIVGAGGAGKADGPKQNSNRGADSSIAGTGITTILAIGGGGGDSYLATSMAATNGGSGGGGAAYGANNSGVGGAGIPQPGGLAVAGQGNNGGIGDGYVNFGGGGGGGAGAVGGTGTVSAGGDGGVGIQSSITGSAVYYAGGGGGGLYGNASSGFPPQDDFLQFGVGGLGGGGDGMRYVLPGAGVDGTANTGGGAGGSHSMGSYSSSASGGSGVVIIRTLATASTTTGSPTVTTDGSYNIYTYTASGSITF